MIVADAGIILDALVPATEAAHLRRRRIAAAAVAAPHLIDIEVANALRRLVRLRRMTPAQASRALVRVQALSLVRHAHTPLLARCWELRDNLTACDAAYVALAEALGVPLLTADARLANAPGIRCEVELLS